MTNDEGLLEELELAYSPAGECPEAVTVVLRAAVAEPPGRRRAELIGAIAAIMACATLPLIAERLRKIAEREDPTAPRVGMLGGRIV